MSSPFLDILPPEVRLHIYTHLLVTPLPIKGPLSRELQSEKYNLHTSILRTNKQIHTEARPVFFSRNIFSIRSVPSADPCSDEEGSGAFEPPLQLKDLPLIRHLELDLLYYPRSLRTAAGKDGLGWHPLSPGANRYVTSLSFVLGAVKASLVSLKLAADVRPYTPEENALDVRKFLTGFHVADQSRRFKDALAALAVDDVALRYDFSESYFDFVAKRSVLVEDSFVHLAGQVLLARSEIQLRVALEELGEEEGRDEEECGDDV